MATLSTTRREISRLHSRLLIRQLNPEAEKEKILKLAEDLANEHDQIWSSDTEPTTEEIDKMSQYQEKLRELLQEVDPKPKISTNAAAEIPKIKIKFSGKKQDWASFLSLFEIATKEASPQEKYLILTNALPNHLKRDHPTTPNAESVENIINALNITFGPIDNNQTLDMVERFNPGSKTPLSSTTGRLCALYHQAVSRDINKECINRVFKKKILQIMPFSVLNQLPMNNDVEMIINKMAEIAHVQTQALEAKRGNQQQQQRSAYRPTQQGNRSNKCALCSRSNHNSMACTSGSARSRKQMAQRRGLCMKCLRPNHKANECRSNTSCGKCKGQHATCLCDKATINTSEMAHDDSNDEDQFDDNDDLVALN